MSVATCDEGYGRRCERVHARQGILCKAGDLMRERRCERVHARQGILCVSVAREAMRKAIREAIRRGTLDIEE